MNHSMIQIYIIKKKKNKTQIYIIKKKKIINEN